MTDPRMTTTVRGGLAGALFTAFVPTLPALLPASAAQAAPVLLSQGGPATASSRENAGTAASARTGPAPSPTTNGGRSTSAPRRPSNASKGAWTLG
ncbi:hypothetical protein ACF05T_08270 [Streptomyces lateritius]|uniref:Uncharacterized protein n=1 Tax=Streptomyces lateritius TaxID=67313 RepID=A0ABW6Y8G9_9ACTN